MIDYLIDNWDMPLIVIILLYDRYKTNAQIKKAMESLKSAVDNNTEVLRQMIKK